MIPKILKNQINYIYLTLWAAVSVVHFLLLSQAYHMGLVNSLLDSLVFNLIFCLLGVGLWFMVEYSGNLESSLIENIIRHVTLGSLTIAVWMGAGNFILKALLPAETEYLKFLDNTLLMRVFTGLMYYGLLNAFFYLIISYRHLREKSEYEARLTTQLREAELNMLRSQIRPHFLFNSLNSISALTITDPGKAHEMIIKLSDFMRYSLTFQGETMSTLEKELYHIRLYLEIEKIRFGEKLKIEYDICPECSAWPVPAMILQPVIENSVKYGVYESTETNGVTVKAEKVSQGFMTVTIMNPYDAEMPAKKGTGTGLANVNRRLETVYKQQNLMFTRKEDNLFTAKITFPYHE
ncbi:MAG: sensor histidine kinase [Bacteroidales bacterium]